MTSNFGVTSFELLKCYLSHILDLISEKLEKKWYIWMKRLQEISKVWAQIINSRPVKAWLGISVVTLY